MAFVIVLMWISKCMSQSMTSSGCLAWMVVLYDIDLNSKDNYYSLTLLKLVEKFANPIIDVLNARTQCLLGRI